ncbi:MAG: hypothetical protein C0469_08210 [Cyanobacteria bacterium DS2.3.42]|nr:hypothetical protein [Cyanobacteria bacterium DS2.3.42]
MTATGISNADLQKQEKLHSLHSSSPALMIRNSVLRLEGIWNESLQKSRKRKHGWRSVLTQDTLRIS